MNGEHSHTFIVFLISAAVGLIGGLVVAWFVSPVEYTSVEPSELRPEFRSTYLQLVASSYAFENDWTRADFRLQVLRDNPRTIAQQVVQVTEHSIAEGRPAPMLRALSKLSDRLGVRTAAMIVYLATPVPTVIPAATPTPLPSPTTSPISTPSPSPTFAQPDTPTPLPTFTPTPTPQPMQVLIARDRVCEPGPAQIRVVVEDENGKGMPGIEVWVMWENGADRFVTGLKPEQGNGYGDFDMQPAVTYAVAIGTSALPLVSDIKTELCPSDDPAQTIYASWKLTFRPIPPTVTPTPSSSPSPSPSSTASTTPTASATVTRTPRPTRKP
jgi:hypothetical protein